MKGNQQIPNVHFRKEWQERVKTWFNQPAKKIARRNARAAKAARVFPRPVAGQLRPVVQCPTARYKARARLGKGFTLEEIKEAGFNNPRVARTLGIAVDHRRRNRSEQSLRTNVQRLKEYQARLVVFPKNVKKPKTGDASEEERNAVVQQRGTIMPITKADDAIEYRAITADDRKAERAFVTLRKARAEAKYKGRLDANRKKKWAEKAEEKASGGKKKKKGKK
eukprot:TRINITY_DN37_c0_g1_i1.p1 TRINITY_DN37_c0_g1~~TRINITY_DN37_c0_g1_i1.p1  ORF type:complete len:223 (+),score=100.57 TRINITY_DN37_c0_g1_i1:59-727(+)